MKGRDKAGRNVIWYGILSVCILVLLCWSVASAQGPVLQISKTADPTAIWQRGCIPTPTKSTVTVELFGGGDCITVGMPVDVMLVLDRSGSMYGAPLDSTKAAAKYFVDLLRNGDRDRAGLVSFGQNVTLNMALGRMDASGKTLLKSAINYLAAGGYTPLGDAVKMANSQFTSGRPGVDWVEIVLSDGDPKTFIGSNPIAAAQQAADRGIVMYVIGLSVDSPVHKAMLQQMADLTGGVYFDVNILSALRGIFEDIAYDIICTAGKDITITETIQKHFNVIGGCGGGFSILPLTCVANYDGSMTATWFVEQLDVGQRWSVSFEIESDLLGTNLPVDVASTSHVRYTNYLGSAKESIPQAYVTVKSCTPVIESSKRDILYGEKYVNGYFSPGDTILYNVSVSNTGYTATGVVYCDTLDNYTTLLSDSITALGGAISVAAGGASFCVDYGTLLGGVTHNISFLAVIDDPVPELLTQVENQGFVASNELADEPSNDPDTAPDDDPTITPIRSEAIIEADKRDAVVGGGNLVPGKVIEYTVVLSNIGNKTVSGLTYYDPIPAHTSYVAGSAVLGCGGVLANTNPLTINNITLAPDGGCTITFRVAVNDCVPAGVSEIVNQGYVQNIPTMANEPTNDPDTVPDDDATRTPLLASPQIVVEKVDAFDAGKPCVEPGEYIDYTVTIRNTGNEGAAGLSFVDTIPDYTSLVAGTFQSSGCGGSAAVVGRVLQMANLPLSCGAQCQVTFQVKVDDSIPEGVESISNQAFVTIPGDGRIPSDDPDTPEPNDPTETCILAGPHITVTKVDAVAGGQSYVLPGGTINYTVRICNEGNQDANGMSFADGIPQYTSYKAGSVSSTCGTVSLVGDTLRISSFNLAANGVCCTVTFSVNVNATVPPGLEWITNQAFVRDIPNGQNTVPSDDPDTPAELNDPTDTPLKQGVNIEVTKRDLDVNGGSLRPGELLQYTVVITNSGPEAANDLTYDDAVPQHTTWQSLTSQNCGVVASENPLSITGINLASGGSCTIIYRVKVDDSVSDEVTQISNQGLVCNIPNRECEPSDDPDTPAEDDDPTDTPLETGVNINVTKVDRDVNGGTLKPGELLEYTIVISNSGPEAAAGLTFEDAVPDYTTWQSLTSQNCGAVASQNPLSITGINLASGGSCTIVYVVRVDDVVPDEVTQISNQGQVCNIPEDACEPSDDPDTPQDDDPTDTPLETGVNINVTKVDRDVNGSPLYPGEVLEYTVTITNSGPEPASGLTYEDPTPLYTTFKQMVSNTCGALGPTSPISITGINLAAGGSCTIKYQVTLETAIPTSVTKISNQGLVCNIPEEQSCEPSDDPGTPTDDDPTDTPLQRPPTTVWDPEVYKVARDMTGGNPLHPGDVIQYTVTIENVMDIEVVDHVFEDPLPAYTHGLTVVSFPAGATNNSTASSVVITGIDIPVAGEVTVVFRVTVDIDVPATVSRISNQGLVHDLPGENQEPSDDPGTAADDDPTVLTLVHETPVWDPYVEALMVAHDANDGELLSGDLIRYLVRVVNTGPDAVYNLIFTCPIPEFTQDLAVLSVPAGSVDISLPEMVTISGIALAVGEIAEIEFTVVVNAALPASAESVTCQGWVGNIPFMEDELTDDPETVADDDATVLTLSETRKCDVNGDGEIGLNDLFLQLRQAVEEVTLDAGQFWAADMDGNGKINIMDLMGCIRISMATPKSAMAASISVPEMVSSQGRLVSIPVHLTSGGPIQGVWLRIDCDPELASAVVSATSWASGLSLVQKRSEQSLWVLLYSDEGDGPLVGQDGQLLTITCQMTEGAEGVAQVRLEEVVVFASPAEAIVLEPVSVGVLCRGAVPMGYALGQNYPNPFNPTTSIEFAVGSGQSASHVSLKIYNVLGHNVATLVDEVKEPGAYSVTWDASQMPSGVYFYTICADGFTAIKRMVLAK